MYGAPQSRRRRTYRFFEPQMDARVKARRTLELDIRQAIAERFAFEAPLSAVVLFWKQRNAGCEALLAGTIPSGGMNIPREFIPVAEETA